MPTAVAHSGRNNTEKLTLLHNPACPSAQLTAAMLISTYSDILMKCIYLIHSKSAAVAEMGDRARAKRAEKWGGAAVPLSVGQLGPHLTQCGLGRGLPLY